MKLSNIKNIVFTILFLVVGYSCSNDDESLMPVGVSEVTQLPTDITKLFIEKGNKSSDKVIIYSNGGPVTTLESSDFNDLELSDYHEVFVHQSNTYNPALIAGLNKDLTYERAIKENEISVEMLYKVAQHFKEKGKKVYMVGHSFGAFLVTSLLATKENTADKYLIMAGRLDIPDIVWKGFRDRTPYIFENGITPVTEEIPSGTSEKENHERYAAMRLQAAVGNYRYTQLLKNKKMDNVIYSYGEKDEAVGRLTDIEVEFLKNKGAVVYPVKGGHGAMFENPHNAELKRMLLE